MTRVDCFDPGHSSTDPVIRDVGHSPCLISPFPCIITVDGVARVGCVVYGHVREHDVSWASTSPGNGARHQRILGYPFTAWFHCCCRRFEEGLLVRPEWIEHRV